MSTRRDLIRGVMAAVGGDEDPQVSVSDCNGVSQINVFSGASINLTFSNIDKSRVSIFSSSSDGLMTDEEREQYYRKCHGIAKQYSIYPQMRKYMAEEWNAESMRALTDRALKSLLRFMRSLESVRK